MMALKWVFHLHSSTAQSLTGKKYSVAALVLQKTSDANPAVEKWKNRLDFVVMKSRSLHPPISFLFFKLIVIPRKTGRA